MPRMTPGIKLFCSIRRRGEVIVILGVLILIVTTFLQILHVHYTTASNRSDRLLVPARKWAGIHTDLNTSLNKSKRRLNISQVRLLCLILTKVGSENKMTAVSNTWAKRCDKFLFVYGNSTTTYINNTDNRLHLNYEDSRRYLTGKVRRMFQHVYQVYNDTFDWILKCDDDTYVIVENLKFLLSHADPKKPAYLGYHMTVGRARWHGYMSGGAGYVINSIALQLLVNNGFKNNACWSDFGPEDVETGLCLVNSGVQILRSFDTDNRESFHPVRLHEYLYPPHPKWLTIYDWNGEPKIGGECCSNFSISYHHLLPSEIYVFEHLLYKTKIYDDKRPIGRNVFNPRPVL